MKIKALTFDTGGTILDWHSGICSAFKKIGERHGIALDWHTVTNDYRRLAMKSIVGQVQPAFNMDDVHRTALDAVLSQHGLDAFTARDRWHISHAWHELATWPDFPAALARIRGKFPVISFTMLPLALVINVSRLNNLDWDTVISCEMPSPKLLKGFDESHNGALILDECGSWLNTRNFQDQGRAELLEWCIHARKYGWDIFFIMQNASQIDKQLRDSLFEYAVRLNRLDRMKAPVHFSAGQSHQCRGAPGAMPRLHIAVVRLGTSPDGLVADRWVFQGDVRYAFFAASRLQAL